MNHPGHAYRKVAIKTCDPRELVIMLYDGFLRFAYRAQASLERGDALDATRSLGRAIDILNELTESLDHTHVPDLSGTLESLYVYLGDRLLHVSARQDITALQEVISLMSELRQGWSEALGQLRRSEAAA